MVETAPKSLRLSCRSELTRQGIFLPLNICVGIIVACTMYTFYTLFLAGEEEA